jgi:hypothetical protein
VLVIDFLLEVIGYTTARAALPIVTLGKVRVEQTSSSETAFGWFGFKRDTDGSYLCEATMAGWIGLIPWALGIVLFIALA